MNVHRNAVTKSSLNNGLKCRKPVFMRVSGIYFIKWLYFGSILALFENGVMIGKIERTGIRRRLPCNMPES